jgi:hypothetical protein
MATIHLTDQFGLDFTLDPDPTSVFSKYVKGLTQADLTAKNSQNISAETVAGYPFATQTLGLSFRQAIPLGTTGVNLTIKPDVSGSITLKAGSDLLDKTLFDKPEARPLTSQKYLSAALEASIEGDLIEKSGGLRFGLNAGTNVELAYSQPVEPTDSLVTDLKTALSSFTIPADIEDLKGMDVKSIASVKGAGSLKFTGTVNLFTATNPLASISEIPLLGKFTLSESGCLKVGVSMKFTGGYEVQVCKLDATHVLLAYSRLSGEELDASITGEIGISGTVGSTDVIKSLLQTLIPDAKSADDDLKKAGLSDDEISALSDAIKAAIQRSLQVSLSAELDLSDENSKAFLYGIDLSALDEAGKSAVHSAIDGDLSALEGGNLAGVTVLRSVISVTREQTRKLNLNLLGIINLGSISRLLQSSTLVVDPDTGDITLSDKTSASNVGLTVNNFAKDGAKLRRIVADGFLATCAYRAGKAGFTTNTSSRCWALALHQSTDPSQIEDCLNIAVSLGLVSRGDADNRLAQVKSLRQCGRSMYQIDSSYDDALFHAMFFDADGQLRPQSFYENKGREAMAKILPSGNPATAARLQPLTNDDLWRQMSEGGQTTFATVFNALNKVEVADITADYTIIKWWASAMCSFGQSLSKLLAFLSASGNTDPNNNTFIALRGDLNKKLKAAAQQVHDQFSEPWGLVAMDMASGQRSQTNLLLTCPRLSLALSRQSPAPLTRTAGVA